MKKLFFLLFVFSLLFSCGDTSRDVSGMTESTKSSDVSINKSEGIVMSRHKNGQKKWVNVYTGTGINEKLTTRYYYPNWSNTYEYKIKYSTNGEPIEKLEYEIDDNGNRFLSVKQTYDDTGLNYISFNSDGTVNFNGTYESLDIDDF